MKKFTSFAIRFLLNPFFIFLLVTALSAFYFYNQTQQQFYQAHNDTEISAGLLTHRLESSIDSKLNLIYMLKQRANYDGFRFSDLQEVIEEIISLFPGFQAINWIDSNLEIVHIIPYAGNEGALGKNLRNHPMPSVLETCLLAIEENTIKRTPPIDLLQGGTGFAVYLPVFRSGKLVGILNAVFTDENLLDNYQFKICDPQGKIICHSENSAFDYDFVTVEYPLSVVGSEWGFHLAPVDHKIKAIIHHALMVNSARAIFMGLLVSILMYFWRKRYQELKEKRGLLENLYRSTSDCIYFTDKDGYFTEVNDVGLKMFGLTADQVIGHRWRSIYKSQKDRETILRLMLRKGHLIDYEITLVKPDGIEIDCAFTANVRYDENGDIHGFQGIIRDISEKKRSQQRLIEHEKDLSATLDNICDAVISLDVDACVTRMNPVAELLLGQKKEDCAGRYLLELVEFQSATDKTSLNIQIKSTFQNTRPLELGSQTILVSETIPARRITGSLIPIIDSDANCTGFVVVLRDIEDEFNLQQKLRQSQKMEAIGQLAGGIAHDFNNILTAIIGNAELADMQLRSKNLVVKELKEIKRVSMRASALTRQLLTFSRRQAVKAIPLRLQNVFTEMETMLERLLGENIILSKSIEGIPWSIFADPSQIEQVIMNLAVNSRDSMPTGGELKVTISNLMLNSKTFKETSDVEPGEYVHMQVEDTGSGISDELKLHVFEPFFTTKAKGKGTGLGLANVYGIIKQFSGQIFIRSTVGVGTTFHILLPRTNLEAKAKPVKKGTVAPGGSETIFIVEDEDTVRTYLISLLKNKGYSIRYAADGQQALESSRNMNNDVDLILSDIVMPNMSGPDFVNAATEFLPDAKVVFMSGYSNDALDATSGINSEIPLIQKPFNSDSLLTKIRHILDDSKN
jgi:two-component system, cell cycle sensor histidine kinase and response regulator CckA